MVLGAMAKTVFLKRFSGSERCFKKGFGASAGPGPEIGPETILKALVGG